MCTAKLCSTFFFTTVTELFAVCRFAGWMVQSREVDRSPAGQVLWSLCSRGGWQWAAPNCLHRNAHSPSRPVAPGSSEKSATEDEEQVSVGAFSKLVKLEDLFPCFKVEMGLRVLQKRGRENTTLSLICCCHRQHIHTGA